MDKVLLSWREEAGHSADLEELLFGGRSGCRAWKQRSNELALWKEVFEHLDPEQIRGPCLDAGAQKSLMNICFASWQNPSPWKA